MSRYFRRYYEAADDSGSEPVEEVEETSGVADDGAPVESESEAPAETYTRDQLVELLGPRFAERFAGAHEGEDALRKFGEAFDNTLSLVGRGAHLEPQDDDFYRNLGIEPPEPEPEEAEGPAIYGAPWEQPTSWEEYVAYAQSDSPEQRRLAAYGVLQAEGPDQATKQWFYNQWAAADPHGAAAYIQQSTISAAEQRLADLEARLEARYAATHEDLVTRNAQDLMETAKSQVKGFEEHAQGVLALWNENQQRMPGYSEWFLAADRPEQLKELRRLTTIAASEAEPVRKAAQAQAAVDTEAAKRRAQTETSRTGGQPDTEQSAAKRKSLEDARRVGHRVF